MATLIVGNISYEYGNAIVHEVLGIIDCENEDQANAIGLKLSNEFNGYVIKPTFKGKIIIEDTISFLGDCAEQINRNYLYP